MLTFAYSVMPQTLQLQFTPTENADTILVNRRFCEVAGMSDATVIWRKRSLDARGKQPIFIITADVYGEGELPPSAQGFLARDVHSARPVHIIGSGPAGLFAALSLIEQGFKPIVLERGKAVKERRRDLAILNKEHIVDEDSNDCFGEGGAGTYSDGKLYTRSTKRGDVRSILETLVFPESVSITSVDVTISFLVTPSKNRFKEISAVSTAREIALPLALIAT